MDIWGLGSEGFDYDSFSEDKELESAAEGLDKSENMLIGFDLDSPFGLEEDVIFMDKQVMERFHEVETGLSEVIRRSPETRSAEDLGVGDDILIGDDMNVASPDCGLGSFSLLGDYDESWSGNSETGRHEAESNEMSKTRPETSVEDSSLLGKQANTDCLSSTNFTCQVEGCNADLTSSKHYYKRHRVCPADTIKATIIINGIQKRFCQQCSRFHLLNEFDDNKRSCRRRLAGHNKRRRKPQSENRFHRPHKLQPYQHQGTRLKRAAVTPRRHHWVDQLRPARDLCPDMYEQINGLKHQGTTTYCPTSATTNIPSSRSRPCLGAEYNTPPEMPSTIQNPSGVLDASYAITLLSNQHQVLFPYFTTSPMIIIQGHNIFHCPATNHGFLSAHMFHANQIGPRILPGTLNPVAFPVSENHNARSLCSNCSKGHVPPQHGSMVDLQQLSFNLSRVEHQRHVR